MTTWAERMTPQAKREPRIELVEPSWRMRRLHKATCILECGVYQTDIGLEVRAGYSHEELLRSQLCGTIDVARDCAEAWRQTVIAKGGFEDLP